MIKDRLKEGVLIKWVHSAAQMADTLTKEIDTSNLRTFLRNGRCLLKDVDVILKQRSERRLKQTWMQNAGTSDAHVCAEYQGK